MEYLLTAAEMAQADKVTSEEIGIPSLVLMERAALGIAQAVREDFSSPGPRARCAVVAGKGNNGADAVAAGRMLVDAGYEVLFFLVTRDGVLPVIGEETRKEVSVDFPMRHPASLDRADAGASWHIDAGERRAAAQGTGEVSPRPAKAPESAMDTQLKIIRAYGLEPRLFTQSDFVEYRPDIILDGLFGTGLSREVGEPFAGAIRLINQARDGIGSRVYSVDIPSGVDGTTGQIMGCAVQADVTVTFAYYKRGHFLYPGCRNCGKVIRREIGITGRSLSSMPGMFTYRGERAEDLLPARSGAGNKGTFGKVLVAAGSKGVSGACTMCAQAVLRTGAGMVKVFTHEDNRVILQETVPEAMCRTYTDAESSDPSGVILEELREDLAWADVAAIGPGLGINEITRDLLVAVLDYAAAGGSRADDPAADCRRFGLVIDADAIRLIAQYNLYEHLRAAGRAARVILTPHMAECAALFHMSVSALKTQRWERAKEFADLYACTLCLKDARTLIASNDSAQMYLNTSGNDGLSTAGSGDILTGVTAACLAQGMEPFPAACAASYLHGCAAEALTQTIPRRALMATDLIAALS